MRLKDDLIEKRGFLGEEAAKIVKNSDKRENLSAD